MGVNDLYDEHNLRMSHEGQRAKIKPKYFHILRTNFSGLSLERSRR